MRPLAIIPAIGLAAGAGIGLLAPESAARPAPIALVAAAACAVYAWRFARPLEFTAWTAVAFLAGGVLLSADASREASHSSLRAVFDRLQTDVRHQAERHGEVVPEEPGVMAIVTGTLKADASPRAGGVAIALAALSVRTASGVDEPVTGGLSLTVAGDLAASAIREWRAGRTVRMPAQLRRPSRYLNAGVPDEERAMNRRGIALVGSVKSGALVEVRAHGTRVAEAAASARQSIRDAVARHVGRWNEQSAGIVTAILIGDRAGLSAHTTRRLQEAGTYHVIAISGGNIAILAALTLAAFRIAGVLGRAAMAAAIAGLIAYWYLVGGGASVTRATLMAVCYFAARAADLRAPPFNTLALVVAVFVAAEPLAVVDPGFLLTVVATGGILVAAPALSAVRLSWVVAAPVSIFAASLAAELALLPVGAMLFSRVTFAGLLLNFAAIPLMAVVQGAGMVVVALSPVAPSAAGLVGRVAALAAGGLVRSADFVDIAPFVTWRVAPPSLSAIGVYYATMAAVAFWWMVPVARRASTRRRRTIVSIAAVIAVVVSIVAEPWTRLLANADGRLHITFLDVGQGDAALIRLPGGGAWVVDAGGLSAGATFDIGDRVVAPALRAAGIRRLDTVAITHGDADHLSGAVSLVEEFQPRDVWEGVPVPPLLPIQALRATAAAVGARWVNVQAQDRLVADGVELRVHHPPVADWERQDVRNDDSIVLELRWHHVSVVLTGDIGRDVERTIAASFAPAGVRVIKVPHHGSRTSSSAEFLQALRPDVAVVSAGRSNTFGHPAADVLDRYRAAGAAIFRTDQDGAVQVHIDPTTVDVQTHSGRHQSWPVHEP